MADLKAEGNAAMKAKDFALAIEKYSSAIQASPTDHTIYSNRSLAYLHARDMNNAVADADKCIELKPDWPRGYQRKAVALKDTDPGKAIATLKSGMEQCGEANEMLRKTLAEVQQSAQNSQQAIQGLQQLFQGDVVAKARNNPKLAKYCDQEDYINMLKMMQTDPKQGVKYLETDPRMKETMQCFLQDMLQSFSGGMGGMGGMGGAAPAPTPAPKKPEPKKEEPKLPENEQKALNYKNKGNEFFKNKQYEEAIEQYTLADKEHPKDITFRNNIVAVLISQQKYDEAIESCKKILEDAKEFKSDFALKARTLHRLGNAYRKKGEFEAAIKAYDDSLMEHSTRAVKKALLEVKEAKLKAEKLAYLDVEKGEEAKKNGDAAFKEKKFIQAIEFYDDAIKRNPNDHRVYSNRAFAYTKLMRFDAALADCNKCIELEPNFAKAYLRKGKILTFKKDYKNAMDTFQKGLDLDPKSREMQEGLRDVATKIQISNATGEDIEARQQQAMNDPEIRQILSTPEMKQCLKELQEDKTGRALQTAMGIPHIKANLQKLIAAGIVA